TLAENVGLPLGEFTDLRPAQIREIAALKLALVGLKGFEDFYPNQISGGMQKRAGLARAMALDPEVFLFDEPSAGLGPISSRRSLFVATCLKQRKETKRAQGTARNNFSSLRQWLSESVSPATRMLHAHRGYCMRINRRYRSENVACASIPRIEFVSA